MNGLGEMTHLDALQCSRESDGDFAAEIDFAAEVMDDAVQTMHPGAAQWFPAESHRVRRQRGVHNVSSAGS
jgi:hypothetical protein